jgi:hypothetical protein
MKPLTLIISTMALATALQAQVIRIPDDYPTIQQGINAADPGDTVLVSEGTYYENINFLGKKPLIVASEFLLDGDTTHISNTIINGSQPVNPDIGSVVTFESGEDTTSVVCGFTITGGTGTMEPGEEMRMGGGIHIKYAGGKLLYNYVHGNTVSHSGAVLGGGMQLGGPVSVIPWIVLRGNRIFNNQAVSTSNFVGGGGVMCYYNLIMENNNISYNEINGHQFVSGGGMACYGEFGDIELRISNNTFTHNKAVTDQGAFGAAGMGGGLGFDINCWGTINNNIISFNIIQAPESFRSYGPGVYVQDNEDGLVFENNMIEENGSTSQNTWGGGVSLNRSGGIYQNNVIRNNTANKGGGVCILNYSSKATLINNTITGNNEGGLYIGYSDAVVINSILYNNTPAGTAIYSVQSNLEVRYSDVEDVLAWPGEGNVIIDPQFFSDGYNLEYSCMLLDKGISSIEIGGVTYNCPLYDIDGDLRPFAGGVPEIGADELQTAAGTEEYRTVDLTIYPNPSFSRSEIKYQVGGPARAGSPLRFDQRSAVGGNVKVTVHDITGKQIRILADEVQAPGEHSVHFDASGLPAGIYVVRLEAGDAVVTEKMVVMR